MLVRGVEGVSDREVTDCRVELGRRVAAVHTLQMSGAISVSLAALATCCSRNFAVNVTAIYRLATLSGFIIRQTCS
jgi:hypothetical protein